MGIKSTYTINRKLAIELIAKNLNKADNSDLATMLECVSPSIYKNFQVINIEPDDDRNVIRTEQDFNEPDFE